MNKSLFGEKYIYLASTEPTYRWIFPYQIRVCLIGTHHRAILPHVSKLVIFSGKNCVHSFEMSNISSGHSTHHQGQMKLLWWKRVLRYEFNGKNYPSCVIARFASPYANLLRRPFSISLCRLEVPFCKSQS
jgi:hypothetical protein